MPGVFGPTLFCLSTLDIFKARQLMIWSFRAISTNRLAKSSGSGQHPCGFIATRRSP
jgi:hypothetical protein